MGPKERQDRHYFEATCTHLRLPVGKPTLAGYENPNTHKMWLLWRAARKLSAATPTKAGGRPVKGCTAMKPTDKFPGWESGNVFDPSAGGQLTSPSGTKRS